MYSINAETGHRICCRTGVDRRRGHSAGRNQIRWYGSSRLITNEEGPTGRARRAPEGDREAGGAYCALQTSSAALTPPVVLGAFAGWALLSPCQSGPRTRSTTPGETDGDAVGFPGATCASAAACWSAPEPYCS